ncbi:hypothetical protein HYPSUDRAFT_220326 [Hypholoma sublateritium FD-334 SS-4]|uniref:Glycan binding protein Y3-like domain-containing protein n=1 Tax=Hypholoma sublateritium (strain FD-334 SS-4) TaxID=945553 RepID=A0A0D2NDU8_HYPSF|nr:hypothetical protein HYPSUDRAFT_220326 [Hypholoma sublateritium FD-334 SS-4]
MHVYLKTIAALAIVALVPSTNAVGCFSGGQAGDCSTAIAEICGQVNGVTFNEGESVATCANVGDFHCNLVVANNAGDGSAISTEECTADMTATNNGCHSHGGIRADGNFLLTLDPNAGSC